MLAAACGSQQQAPEVESEPVEQVETAPAGPPTFESDPSWPKPLPNNWALGDVWGVAIDSQDNPWIAHANSDRIQALLEEEGKELAPPVIQFDPEGNVLQAWGWPRRGLRLDGRHVRCRARPVHRPRGQRLGHRRRGPRADGGVVLKFTPEGDFLLQIGENGETNGSLDERLLGGPTTAAVHPDTNEVFIADGYTNQRVIVFDAVNGDFKRLWGAYGNPPDDGPEEPLNPDGPAPQRWEPTHCVRVAHDGLVYVCDRGHNRVHIFETDGTFVDELFVERATPAPWQFDLENNRYLPRDEPGPGVGSALDGRPLARPPSNSICMWGPATSYRKIYIVDRQTLEPGGRCGHPGGEP